MALGDSRRAGGRGLVKERRSYNGQSERQAIGTSNTSERRGVEVVDELNSLVNRPATKPALRAIPPIGPVPAKRGTGTYKAPATGPSTGTGIASPLVEVSYASREYWPEQTLLSSDGILSFKLKAIKRIVQMDSNTPQQQVVQQFSEPTTP